jgi:hypothetical protein
VYWKLNNHLKDCKIEECILERLMALKDKRVACLERHIVTPDQIAENLMGNCSRTSSFIDTFMEFITYPTDPTA